MERIALAAWREQRGHVERYEAAAALCEPGDRVLDVACGIGYGAQVIGEIVAVDYLGLDRPGVPEPAFADWGRFRCVDLDQWTPGGWFDLGACFETLEHVNDPQRLADAIDGCCERLIVSVPTVPTRHANPHHLHDFALDDLLGLFSHREPLAVVAQPHELSHVVTFGPRR